jgi:outer membrane protein
MIKKTLTLISFVLLLSVSSFAQRIAVIDITDLLENLPEYGEAQAELDRVAAEWRQEIAQEYDQIKSMYNKYQAEQVLLSEDIRVERENEIMEKEGMVRELQKRKFGPEGELFLKRQELVTPIQEKVYTTIEDFATDRGYDLIFDKGGSAGLIFSSEEYDKTEIVKKRLGIR